LTVQVYRQGVASGLCNRGRDESGCLRERGSWQGRETTGQRQRKHRLRPFWAVATVRSTSIRSNVIIFRLRAIHFRARLTFLAKNGHNASSLPKWHPPHRFPRRSQCFCTRVPGSRHRKKREGVGIISTANYFWESLLFAPGKPATH
jgi:hypothetical protein